MKIKFTYFKETGKYYGEGEAFTLDDHPVYVCFETARRMVKEGDLPGLTGGIWEGTIVVEVDGLPRVIQGHTGCNEFLLEE